MTTLSRMSPYNIAEDLVRVELYREIRKGGEGWVTYEIQPDEILMPELTAYRLYGTDALKWVILIAAGLDDMREPMESGLKITVPPMAWIRERIKHYAGDTWDSQEGDDE